MAIFDETNQPDTVNLETLVGEGKKYKNPDELAKAYANADLTIKARETELATLRQELATRLSVEEAISKHRPPNDSAQSAPAPRQDTTPTAPATSQEDLDNRILEVTKRAQAEQRQADNLDRVIAKLREVFGTDEKANQVVRQKAAELGVSTQFLLDSAKQSPTAFFKQMDLVDSASGAPRQAPRSEVNPRAMDQFTPGVKAGTYEFYEQLRKTDPKNFFTPKVQNQLMKDAFAAAERGESWGS